MGVPFAVLPLFARIYTIFLAVVTGLVMGSALNCLAYRLAHDRKWESGRSICPQCEHTLHIADLVPVFSWLFLRGRCRYCGKPISPRYPLSELCLGICFGTVVWRFGWTLQTVTGLILCGCLFCLSLVDLDIQIIPDRFWIIPAVARVIQLVITGGLIGLWNGVWPALVLGGALLIISLIMDKVLGRESLGGGDIKLIAMLGLYFSLKCGLLLLFVSCAVGLLFALITRKMKKSVPFAFGPAISISAWITLLFGEQIVDWYLSFFMR